MKITLADLLSAYNHGIEKGRAVSEVRVTEATAALVSENSRLKRELEVGPTRLIEGLCAMAGVMERLPGIRKPDLSPSKKMAYRKALAFVDALDPEAEYVKRSDVLEQFFQLDPRIRGPLAVRYPEMVHQRKP